MKEVPTVLDAMRDFNETINPIREQRTVSELYKLTEPPYSGFLLKLTTQTPTGLWSHLDVPTPRKTYLDIELTNPSRQTKTARHDGDDLSTNAKDVIEQLRQQLAG